MKQKEIKKLKNILRKEIKKHMHESAYFYADSFRLNLEETVDVWAEQSMPQLINSIGDKLLNNSNDSIYEGQIQVIFEFFEDNFDISAHEEGKEFAATKILGLITEFHAMVLNGIETSEEGGSI